MLFCFSLFGQTQIERSVIGSGNVNGTIDGNKINSSIGEIAVQTKGQNPNRYTEGFQQPIRIRDEIFYTFRAIDASCIGQSNGFAFIEDISGCAAPYTILWSNGQSGRTARNLAPGTYTVQITSQDGCVTSSYSFDIATISYAPCLLKFYSGITPNNDGLNDKWIIDDIEAVPNNEVNIYNRLGNLVWKGKNYNNTNIVWAGQNLSNNESPSDTYFFVFEAPGIIEKGWIELTR